MTIFADRVAFETPTTGTGTVDVGDAISPAFFTPAEAGITNGAAPIPYVIQDGTDVEIGHGTYNTGTPATFSRDTVIASKISGTAGTSKLDLSGNARVRFTLTAAELAGFVGTGDARLADAREWTADTVSQAEAEAGVATTRRAWTAERVKQAIAALGAVADGAITYAKMASSALASFTEFNSATSSKILTTSSVWGNLAVLTDGATISVDLDAGYDFGGTSNNPLGLGGNRTLGAPSNARNGKKGILWFTASGSTRVLTLHSSWVLIDGVEIGPYSIGANKVLGVAYACCGATVFVTGILRVS